MVGIRLVLVRQLFDIGIEMAGRLDDVSRMAGLAMLQASLEAALRAFLDDRGKPQPPHTRFDKVTDVARHDGISTAPAANRVAHARNGALHDGAPPTEATATDAVLTSRRVLVEIFKALSRDFETFGVTSLVRNRLVRSGLDKAEALFESGRLLEATAMASWANTQLVRNVGRLVDKVVQPGRQAERRFGPDIHRAQAAALALRYAVLEAARGSSSPIAQGSRS